MALPRMHDDREYCLFTNERGQPVGECALEARGWLADHPEYRGRIYGDWNIGSPRDHFDATTMFFPEDDEPDVAPEPLTPTVALGAVNLADELARRSVEGFPLKPTCDEHGNWSSIPAHEVDGADKRVLRAAVAVALASEVASR